MVNIILELLETTDRKEAITIETNLTIDFINQFGIENVAGGRIVGDLKRRKRILKNEFKIRIFDNVYYLIVRYIFVMR